MPHRPTRRRRSNPAVEAARAGRALPGHMLADPGFRGKLEREGIKPNLEGGLIGQFGKDIAGAVMDAPRGYYRIGRLVSDLVQNPIPTDNDNANHEKMRQLIEETRRSYGGVLRHPLRHPGDTVLSLLALGTGSAALGLRAPRVIRNAKQPTDRPRPASKPSELERDLAMTSQATSSTLGAVSLERTRARQPGKARRFAEGLTTYR